MSPRTEKEKMLAGEIYTFFDPELELIRQMAQRLYRLFNTTEDASERQDILHQLFGEIGQDCVVEPPFYCSYGQNIHLGDHVYINYQCTIIDNNEVRIGSHGMVRPLVQMYTAAHPLQAGPRNKGLEVTRPILIEDNVWLGGGCILLPGVRIGRNAVVGAGAVVTRDVPVDTIVAGNPARVVREIDQNG